MKTIQLPRKPLYPLYRDGALEFYASQKDYDNGFDKYIELPRWMAEAIDEYAKVQANIAVEAHLKGVRQALGIS